jgi:hypothetical protein
MNTNNLKPLEVLDEFKIQNPEEVAFRAICLSGLIIRGELEKARFHRSDEGAEVLYKKAKKVNNWFKETGAHNFLTPRESLLLRQPFGEWNLERDYNFEHSNNQLGVLLWALSILQTLPEMDRGFSREIHWYTGIPTSTQVLFETIEARNRAELLEAWVDFDKAAFRHDHLDVLVDLYGEEPIFLDGHLLDRIKFNAETRASTLAWILGMQPGWDEQN